MTANVDAMVRAGVEAYRAGNRSEARALLERAIEIDGYNEVAWLWLSAVVDTTEEQRTCLENVLVINPNNDRAKQGLHSLGIDPDTIIKAEPAADAADAASAFTDEGYDAYQVPSSSTSVNADPVEPTSEQYDDWVDGLNLGSETGSSGNSIFSDDDFVASDTFQLDDNFYADDELFADEYAEGDLVDDDYYDQDPSAYNQGYDTFGDDADALYADAGTMDDFASAMDSTGDYDSATFDDYATDNASFIEDEAFFDIEDPIPSSESTPITDSGPSANELFNAIPAEIEAGRLPGDKEPVATIHYILVGVLLLVNLGALGFIGLTFMG